MMGSGVGLMIRLDDGSDLSSSLGADLVGLGAILDTKVRENTPDMSTMALTWNGTMVSEWTEHKARFPSKIIGECG
jgi:hypothetical protein